MEKCINGHPPTEFSFEIPLVHPRMPCIEGFSIKIGRKLRGLTQVTCFQWIRKGTSGPSACFVPLFFFLFPDILGAFLRRIVWRVGVEKSVHPSSWNPYV
jgi:hypothetical protein